MVVDKEAYLFPYSDVPLTEPILLEITRIGCSQLSSGQFTIIDDEGGRVARTRVALDDLDWVPGEGFHLALDSPDGVCDFCFGLQED